MTILRRNREEKEGKNIYNMDQKKKPCKQCNKKMKKMTKRKINSQKQPLASSYHCTGCWFHYNYPKELSSSLWIPSNPWLPRHRTSLIAYTISTSPPLYPPGPNFFCYQSSHRNLSIYFLLGIYTRIACIGWWIQIASISFSANGAPRSGLIRAENL